MGKQASPIYIYIRFFANFAISVGTFIASKIDRIWVLAKFYTYIIPGHRCDRQRIKLPSLETDIETSKTISSSQKKFKASLGLDFSTFSHL